MPTYSHSRLETYQNCPRQYKLQYIDKVEIEEVVSIEAFMGKRVHEVLEKLYKDVGMTRIPSLEETLSYYDRLWDENFHEGISIVRADYTAEDYKEVGRRCIAEYYEKHHPFDASRTIALENLVFFPLEESSQYWIRGVIDRLSISKDGVYEIHDYKTSGRLKTQEDVDKDRQLALYHIAIERMWQDVKQIDLVWHYLAFGKELRSRRSPAQLNNLRQEVMDIIKSIESDKDFRPRESALCDWCVYPEYCPAKKHVTLTSKLAVNEYLKEPGVELVNKFAELHRQRNQLEDEIGRVREALIHYGKEKQMEVIRGSDHMVLVRIYRNLAFPPKDDPRRAELEKRVKEAGLWEQVAVLSPVSLAKLIESGKVEPRIAQQIRTMGREEDRPWVKLSPLRRDRRSL